MDIKKGTSIAVIVRKSWANLYGVRVFIREGREIRDSHDDSHILFARLLDSGDACGLWIETNTGKHESDPSVRLLSLMIPWHEVVSIAVLRDDLYPELWAEAKKLGFVSGADE